MKIVCCRLLASKAFNLKTIETMNSKFREFSQKFILDKRIDVQLVKIRILKDIPVFFFMEKNHFRVKRFTFAYLGKLSLNYLEPILVVV